MSPTQFSSTLRIPSHPTVTDGWWETLISGAISDPRTQVALAAFLLALLGLSWSITQHFLKKNDEKKARDWEEYQSNIYDKASRDTDKLDEIITDISKPPVELKSYLSDEGGAKINISINSIRLTAQRIDNHPRSLPKGWADWVDAWQGDVLRVIDEITSSSQPSNFMCNELRVTIEQARARWLSRLRNLHNNF